MIGGPSFLSGAESRLLPMSIPFRFFAAAGVFHILFWLSLALSAADIAGFQGGSGPALATIHLLTLGVMVMTVIGASVQLLPVATRRPVLAIWPLKVLFLLMLCGVPILVSGMALHHSLLMKAGSTIVTIAIIGYLIYIGENLLRSKGYQAISKYTGVALLCLFGLSVIGYLLIVNYSSGFFADHATFAEIHFILALFGFMGLLAFGFSFILIPMFALSASPTDRFTILLLVLSLIAISCGIAGALYNSPELTMIALIIGTGAALYYAGSMIKLMKGGMRKRLGISFVLIRFSWAMLPVGLILGAVFASGLTGNSPDWTLFGFIILVGWLLSLLLGIMQRIVPFLSSMHSSTNGKRPALLSFLTPERPLQIHAGCHLTAFAITGAGIALGMEILIKVGALIGVVGAVAFLIFIRGVVQRLNEHLIKD